MYDEGGRKADSAAWLVGASVQVGLLMRWRLSLRGPHELVTFSMQ